MSTILRHRPAIAVVMITIGFLAALFIGNVFVSALVVLMSIFIIGVAIINYREAGGNWKILGLGILGLLGFFVLLELLA